MRNRDDLDDVMAFVREVAPLARTLVHPDNDRALDILRGYLPELKIEGYPSGKPVWTWRIPNQWMLKEARIEDAATGKLLWNGMSHPLATVNYSLPFEGTLTAKELAPHLYAAVRRPKAIPFVFRFYNRDWGFCMPVAARAAILKKKKLRVRIVTDERPGELKVGSLLVPGTSEREFVICTNICHPSIANDSISGAAAAIALARHVARMKDRQHSYRFLWLPETIGSIAFLAHHEDLLPRMAGGLFIEMLGNRNTLCLQRSRSGASYWDLVALATLRDAGQRFRTAPFLEAAANDEKVFDAPGAGVPMVSITRAPYPEYHTSDDNVALIDRGKMQEAIALLQTLLDRLEGDYLPLYRSRGPVGLAEQGLYPDWYRHPELKDKWEAFVKVMYALDSGRSVEQLGAELGLPAAAVRYWCDAFAGKGFLEKRPVPW